MMVVFRAEPPPIFDVFPQRLSLGKPADHIGWRILCIGDQTNRKSALGISPKRVVIFARRMVDPRFADNPLASWKDPALLIVWYVKP